MKEWEAEQSMVMGLVFEIWQDRAESNRVPLPAM